MCEKERNTISRNESRVKVVGAVFYKLKHVERQKFLLPARGIFVMINEIVVIPNDLIVTIAVYDLI